MTQNRGKGATPQQRERRKEQDPCTEPNEAAGSFWAAPDSVGWQPAISMGQQD